MKRTEAAGQSLQRHLSSCELCPRRCRVNRLEGQYGYCGAGAGIEIYRAAPHFGEEPPVSGGAGSGTVFFSRCTLRCLYCQNYPWSQEGAGVTEDSDGLARRLRELYEAGCHNWNLVSPTPWLPRIAAALDGLRAEGVSLPVVFNTSGYERVETLREIEGMVDVYLADLRYSRDASAAEGSDASDYVATARRALMEMHRQAGPPKLNRAGVMERGLICRLLVLPGRAEEAVENLAWLADRFGPDGVGVSVMSQYTPAYRATAEETDAVWSRPVTAAEFARVREAAEEQEFTTGWIQDYDADTLPELVGYRMPSDSARGLS